MNSAEILDRVDLNARRTDVHVEPDLRCRWLGLGYERRQQVMVAALRSAERLEPDGQTLATHWAGAELTSTAANVATSLRVRR